jgi:hypothetical protein
MKDANHVIIYIASLLAYLVASYFKIGDASSNLAILGGGLYAIGVTGVNSIGAATTANSIAKANAGTDVPK